MWIGYYCKCTKDDATDQTINYTTNSALFTLCYLRALGLLSDPSKKKKTPNSSDYVTGIVLTGCILVCTNSQANVDTNTCIHSVYIRNNFNMYINIIVIEYQKTSSPEMRQEFIIMV